VAALIIVTFYGVRGSTPCCGPELVGYGGNTSCVAIESPGAPPVICDLGTGLRMFGATQRSDVAFRGVALVTHLHWDHVQGLPFFVPLLRDGAQLDVFGPTPDSGQSLCREFADFLRPPVFPVCIDQFAGTVEFHEVDDDEFEVGGWRITSRSVPHVGATNGYRIEREGCSVAYISDHQQPVDGSFGVAPGAVDLARDVDLLIHDAQYTPAEFAARSTWGHCTVEYACHLAKVAGARRLALFHHDPSHHDQLLDELAACAREWGVRQDIEVLCAAEGLTVTLGS
jgi:phosphoribosyl 1,2-cyclic phosphodiesterase